MLRKAFVHSPDLEKYHYPPDCPFTSERAGLTRALLQRIGLLTGHDVFEHAPETARREQLTDFHTPAYLDALAQGSRGLPLADPLSFGLSTPDCPIFAGMYEYAALASGASIAGARLILEGQAHIAFNPSGGYHHAAPGHAAGFCYINDIVLAALALLRAGKRVLFLDLDIHHCDGVQNAFYARKDIMTLSMHESGKTLFPGTGFTEEIGEGEGRGYSVNLPLPVGTYDAAYFTAFRQAALPLMKAFDPDVIIAELGMDTLAGDPLGHLSLTNNVYADILPLVMDLGKPMLATGGGGYHVENTVRGWALCWRVLCGDHYDDMNIGMGGVMTETSEWAGGLRDRPLTPTIDRRTRVDAAVAEVVAAVKKTLFPLHGLGGGNA